MMACKRRRAAITLPAAVLLSGLSLPVWSASAGPPPQSLTIGERLTIHSKVLGEDRTVLVALPTGYHESEARYPVLYVMDGEFFFHQAYGAVQFLSECTYIRTHPVPQMLVVGVVNVDRNRDLTPTHTPVQGPLLYPTSGGAVKFLAFLRSELIPFIDARYRTQPYRVLAGWSFGGLFTVETFLDHPDAFSAYLAISPSLWWNGDAPVAQLRSMLRNGTLSSKPLVVTIGALEGGDMNRSVRKGLFPLLRTARAPSLSFTPIEIPDTDHSYSPYGAFFAGLRALFAEWALPQAALSGGLEGVSRFYKQLSQRVGYEVAVPESAYQALVGSLSAEKNDTAALKIARLACERFPTSSRALQSLGAVLRRTGDRQAARATFLRAIEVEKGLKEPDSERIMEARLYLWLLDRDESSAKSKDK